MIIEEYFMFRCDSEADQERAKSVFRDLQFDAEEVHAGLVRALVVHASYSWKPWQAIHAAFQQSGLQGELNCYRNRVFADQEWDTAAFWEVGIGDSPLRTDWKKCLECQRKYLVSLDGIPYSKKVPGKKQLFSHCQFNVVSRSGKDLLESSGLKGLAFTPFDQSQRYFSFEPLNTLQRQTFLENEFEGDRLVCTACGRMKGLCFGPYRFARFEWDGSDFVALKGWPDFIYCTQRAYRVLEQLDKSISREGLVVLE